VQAHGAPAGRQVVAGLAALLRGTVRADAAIARLDEYRFAVANAGQGLEDCAALAEHLRVRALQELAARIDDSEPGSVTVSIGVDALPATAPGSATLVERAEQALQRARRAGGNRVSLFSSSRSSAVGGGEADA
jgi:diguanylate cyclase (GGDEF)-like protein